MSADAATDPGDGEDAGVAGLPGSIGVLGPVDLLGSGRGELGGPQRRLVLALLTCDVGRVLSVDRLITEVWGEAAGSSSRRTLQVHVSALRKALEGIAVIEHRGGGYALEATDDAVDATRFEGLVDEADRLRRDAPGRAADRLQEALGLWRGRPFGELATGARLAAEANRLEQLHLRAIEALSELEIEGGRQDLAVARLQRHAHDHPLRESLWRLLMLGLYRTGRQAEALATYETIRNRLADDLGADPSPALRELHTAVLRQDPALAPPPRAPAHRPAPELGDTRRRLVGRERELSRLGSLARAAVAGRPHLVLIGGEAGGGKSRLLDEAGRAAAADGVDVLVGRCVDLGDSALPFAPIAQILRRLARRSRGDELDEWLGSARHDLARLAPELGGDTSDLPPADPDLRGRVLSAVLRGLGRLARHRPLIVAFEDVHWADPSTLALLGFLARNLDRERVLVVATFRTDELHRQHPLRGVVGELGRLDDVVRMDLERLTPDESSTLVHELLGASATPELVAGIVTRAAGNPFYLEELAGAATARASAPLPSGLRDALAARLDRLPDPARELLKVTAVAGGHVDQGLLVAVSGEEPPAVSERLRPAVDHHVLEPQDSGYRFRHDLVREAVAAEILPGERITLHARIAAALEHDPRLASGGPGDVHAEVAHHWYAAREDRRAFAASSRAAERALAAGALAEALTLQERVLELWDRVDHGRDDRVAVLEHAARTAWLAGRYRRGEALLHEALRHVGDDPVREAALRCELALALARDASSREAAVTEADRALDLVSERAPSRAAARAMHTAARVRLVFDDVGERTQELAEAALRTAGEVGDHDTELHARNTLGSVLVLSGRDVDTGLSELRSSLRLALAAGDREATFRGHNNLVVALRASLELDRDIVDRAIGDALSWLDQPQQRGHLNAQAIIRTNIAMTALFHDEWSRAERALDELPVRYLEGYDRAYFLTTRALLRWGRGQLDQALEDARAVLDLPVDDSSSVEWAHTIEAFVAAEQGRLQDVRRVVARRSEIATATDEVDGEVVGTDLRLLRVLVRAEVDAALATDGPERVAHLRAADGALTGVRDRHRELQDPHLPVTPATRHLAETNLRLATAERDRAGGGDPDHWRRVLEHVAPRYERIYARWRLGEALLAAGADAEDVLRAAHEEAVAQGAAQLRMRIERTAADGGIGLDATATLTR